jgi:hypothetical protein
MAINLDTPHLIRSVAANRFDIPLHTVENRPETGPVLTVHLNAYEVVDGVATLVENMAPRVYVGDRIQAIIVDAGERTVSGALTGLPDEMTLGELRALLATNNGKLAAGGAYYAATRDSLYQARRDDGDIPA